MAFPHSKRHPDRIHATKILASGLNRIDRFQPEIFQKNSTRFRQDSVYWRCGFGLTTAYKTTELLMFHAVR
ncbi:MAG: hypothetical protein WBD58_08615 [Geitlerinemataceae cyanobacterium]